MLQLGNTLANPVWHALGTVQQHLNAGSQQLRFFAPDVAPFAGMENWDAAALHHFEINIPTQRRMYLMQETPVIIPPSLQVHFTVPLYQMICVEFQPAFQEHALEPLTEVHIPQMLELTALTKPGPFVAQTIQFGGYVGVFDGDQLIAMGGERLKVPGYTEVSAICTHPEYRGRQLARHILSHVSQQIIHRGEVPFLHSLTTNEPALKVYQQLGYRLNRNIFFAIVEKQTT
ncbi:GNAT family N-acetyltransferase [Phnomibacter ginsenosidimutans]|uniref:GNAT family N-acetyltransferase n=1 Tax=Phnomibacter ginsenosidimutans TaxID=2676868 RepID=A0A6I6G5S0_9BACT|nr:GNAT family N-acetyltransferase [Phnomibacter ginsenosidimutans]QGW26723.1 GNAT family N-acetyltransferase [Phnomibacter ginsenosidimutans]